MFLRRHRGFTLIEVIVSIFILGIVIVLSGAVIGTIQTTRDEVNENIAMRIASTNLDALRATGYANVVASSTLYDTQLTKLPSATASSTISDYNAKTKQVTVGVSWLASRGTKYVTLTTLITSVGGL